MSEDGGVYLSGSLGRLKGYLPAHTVLLGAILAQFIEQELFAQGIEQRVWLKWPNDILLLHSGKLHKVAGVLCEAQSGADKKSMVAGIGVNLTQQKVETQKETPHGLPPIALLPGKSDVDAVQFARRLAEWIESCWSGSIEEGLAKRWQEVSPVPYWVHSDAGSVAHQGVTAEGYLELKPASQNNSVGSLVWQDRKPDWKPSLEP